MTRESDIVHETPTAWVFDDKKRGFYTVFRVGVTHSTSDCSFARNADGLSLAIARANYLNRSAS